MLKLNIFKIDVFISASFIFNFIIPFVLNINDSLIKAITTSLMFGSIMLFTSFLHELFHVLSARMFNIPAERIDINFFSGTARIKLKEGYRPVESIIISLAGPFANLILFSIFSTLNLFFPMIEFFQMGSIINLILLVVNLIPVYPLDGGRALRDFLFINFSKEKAKYISRMVTILIGVIIIVINIISLSLIVALFSVMFFSVALPDLLEGYTEHVLKFKN